MNKLQRILLIMAVVLSQAGFTSADLNAQQRYGRPTPSTEVSASGKDLSRQSAREREKQKIREQKEKDKERKELAKQKEKARKDAHKNSSKPSAKSSQKSSSDRSNRSASHSSHSSRSASSRPQGTLVTEDAAPVAAPVADSATESQEPQVAANTYDASEASNLQISESSNHQDRKGKAGKKANAKPDKKAKAKAEGRKAKADKPSKEKADKPSKAKADRPSKAKADRPSKAKADKAPSRKSDSARSGKPEKTDRKKSKTASESRPSHESKAESRKQKEERHESRAERHNDASQSSNRQISQSSNRQDREQKADNEPMSWKPQNIIGFGPKGGIASFLPENGQWVASRPANLGYVGAFDIDYTFLGVNSHDFGIGFHIGATVGYTKSGQSVYLIQSIPGYVDVLGNTIDYRITADNITERNSQLQVEVPVQLALKIKGFYANLGVRFYVPFLQQYTQEIGNVSIDAYYTKYDVHVIDKPAIGTLAEADKQLSGTWNGYKWGVSVAGEIGYYIPCTEHFLIGLGLYADYMVYNQFANTPTGQLFTVSGVGTGPTSAVVHAVTLNQAYTQRQGYFDLGGKLSFCFKF